MDICTEQKVYAFSGLDTLPPFPYFISFGSNDRIPFHQLHRWQRTLLILLQRITNLSKLNVNGANHEAIPKSKPLISTHEQLTWKDLQTYRDKQDKP